MKGDKSIKSSTFSKMRKRLSDISNLHSQHKSPFKNQENVLIAPDNSSSKNYMEKILQDNAVMKKLIEEKDKIIETNGVELQMMRINCQKTQLQNWHLAQSNTQMLAELNMAKDRLKTLQHELLCKDAVSKAMILELKEKEKVRCETNGQQEGDPKPKDAAMEQPQDCDNNENKVPKPKEDALQGVNPWDLLPLSKLLIRRQWKTKGCLRRQSVGLKPPGKQDDLFEIEVEKDAVNQTTHFSRRKSNSIKAEDEDCFSESSESARSQRSSIVRPQRRVTGKVQSYKDPPLNKKMRRPS